MIFCNGDSITFGCELHKDNLEYIKENRFSRILEKKLDKEVVNIAEIGMVNDSIVRTTIKWIEENGDPEFALIQFGPDIRVEWYHPEWKEWINFGPNATQSRIKIKNGEAVRKRALPVAMYYYSEYDNKHIRQMNMWKNIYMMETYLNNKGIPHYFWHGKGNPREEKRTYDDLGIEYKQLSKWKHMKEMCDIIGTKNKHPENFPVSRSKYLGLEFGMANGIHPNENGHKLLAEHFLEHII